MSIFSYLPQLLYYAAIFPFIGKLKDIILHFPYEISIDINSVINPVVGQFRSFPNLIPTQTLIFSLYLSKFANSLITSKKSKLAEFEAYFSINFTNF